MSPDRWILAARPATLWAGVAPVLVGAALAFDEGAWRWDAAVGALIVALALQIGVNFANDLSDAARGADDERRIGPVRAVASGLISASSMKRGIAAAFAVAGVAGLYLAAVAGPIVLVVGAASFAAALGYTGGPLPYGYRGLGELFVFVFFGLVATVGTRYVFDGSAPEGAWLAGTAMGLLAAAILLANNVRDVDTDRASGKRTLAVLLGRAAARRLYVITIAAAFAVVAAGAALGVLPAGALLCLVAAPLAIGPIRAVTRRTDGPGLIAALKATARLQIVAAALLGAGIVL